MLLNSTFRLCFLTLDRRNTLLLFFLFIQRPINMSQIPSWIDNIPNQGFELFNLYTSSVSAALTPSFLKAKGNRTGIPGNPPSLFRSQSKVSCVLVSGTMVTVNRPPVAGLSDTSPRVVPNVERSSCANFTRFSYLFLYKEKAWEEERWTYICGPEHPFALSAVCDCDSGKMCVFCLRGWRGVILNGRYWFCHFDQFFYFSIPIMGCDDQTNMR